MGVSSLDSPEGYRVLNDPIIRSGAQARPIGEPIKIPLPPVPIPSGRGRGGDDLDAPDGLSNQELDPAPPRTEDIPPPPAAPAPPPLNPWDYLPEWLRSPPALPAIALPQLPPLPDWPAWPGPPAVPMGWPKPGIRPPSDVRPKPTGASPSAAKPADIPGEPGERAPIGSSARPYFVAYQWATIAQSVWNPATGRYRFQRWLNGGSSVLTLQGPLTVVQVPILPSIRANYDPDALPSEWMDIYIRDGDGKTHYLADGSYFATASWAFTAVDALPEPWLPDRQPKPPQPGVDPYPSRNPAPALGRPAALPQPAIPQPDDRPDVPALPTPVPGAVNIPIEIPIPANIPVDKPAALDTPFAPGLAGAPGIPTLPGLPLIGSPFPAIGSPAVPSDAPKAGYGPSVAIVCRFQAIDLSEILRTNDRALAAIGSIELIGPMQGMTLARRVETLKRRFEIQQAQFSFANLLEMHNGLMQSADFLDSVTNTFSGFLDNFINEFGLTATDDLTAPPDFAETIQQSFVSFVNALIGQENWANFLSNLLKQNRIVTSSANLFSSLSTNFQGTNAVAEVLTNNVSRIGNALKKSRIVGENDYKWMPVGLTGLIGRGLLLFGALTGSGVVELPDLTNLFGKKPLSIDEETLLLAQNQQDFRVQIANAEEPIKDENYNPDLPRPIGKAAQEENVPQTIRAEATREASKASDLSSDDLDFGG